jgi:hypothetical protein
LLVDGHIVTGGTTPTVTVPVNQVLGSSIEGNDTSGTLTLTGAAGSQPGVLATVTFAEAYDKVPRIALTSISRDALNLNVYLEKTITGFKLVTDDTPAAGKTYQFDYIVLE